MEKIVTKLRDLIQDNLQNAYDVFEYTTSNIFTLSEANAQESTIDVYVNGAPYNGSGQWSFDSDTNKITISGLTGGDVIEINYNAYIKYSDEELKSYIRASFVYLSTEKYKDFMNSSDYIFPAPSESEENLIALVASILIKDTIKAYRTPEFTVTFEDSMSKEEKIRRAVRKYRSFHGVLEYVDLGKNIYIEDEN